MFGALFGFVLQRSRFCFLCVWRDLLDRGDPRGVLGILAALAVGMAGYAVVFGAWLPDYRGVLPAFWVLANGESQTGVTVHYMSEKVDLGPIIAQERVPIRADDTVHTLVQRTKLEVGGPLLVRAIRGIEQGTAAGRPSDPSAGRAFGYPDADAVRRFRARRRRFV